MNGTFNNPILAGDYADPSIIRVGDVYYMTHSSFPYGPGLLLWQSKNLVDWQPIVRALRVYDGDVWAPELVYHNRRFYIYYPTGGKNHVIWADCIEGPWSDPIDLHVGHIDPGHVVASDGTRYLHLSGGHLVQLTDDGLATVGEVKKVYDGWPVPAEWRIEGNCLESPKLIFRDGYYHLISAQGGTAGPSTSHMIVHARSRQINGPWENSPLNPILRTKRRDEHWWSRGHGTLIDTPAGGAYIVYHAYERGYQTLGRQVLLQPVTWTQDGWLRVEGDPSQPIAAPPGERLPHGLARSDDFATPALGLQWQFWAGTGQGRVQIEQSTLRMTAAGESPADCSPMVCMAADHAYEVEVDLDCDPSAEAGLVLFYSPKCYTALSLSRRGIRIGIRGEMVHFAYPAPAGPVRLRIVNDHNEIDFWYGPIDGPMTKLPESLDVSTYQHNAFGGFLSLRPGLFCAGAGVARFGRFRYTRIADRKTF